MKNLMLIILIATFSTSLSAQTLKVSYKSHSSSMTTFNLSTKSFGLPDHMMFEKFKKIEDKNSQTIKTKPIKTLSTTPPTLKEIKISTPKSKETLKKEQKEAKKAAKKKAKEARKKKKSEKKSEKKKSISQASLVGSNAPSSNVFQLLLLLIGVIVVIVAALPIAKK